MIPPTAEIVLIHDMNLAIIHPASEHDTRGLFPELRRKNPHGGDREK
jgi:hypothetical protein